MKSERLNPVALSRRHRRFVVCTSIVMAAHLLAWGALLSVRSAHANAASAGTATPPMVVSLLPRFNDVAQPTAQHSYNAPTLPALDADADTAPPQSAASDVNLTAAALPALLAYPEHYYYQTAELTRRPDILVDNASDLAFHLPGFVPSTTVLHLFINQYGEVDEVVIDDATLPETIRQSVLAAFKTNRFTPGELNGLPVKTRMTIEVTLQGRSLELPLSPETPGNWIAAAPIADSEHR